MTTDIKPIVKNAINCTICQAPADRYANYFQCQKNPNHMADLMTGTFSDLTHPSEQKEKEARQ